jgi:hypothetical protein
LAEREISVATAVAVMLRAFRLANLPHRLQHVAVGTPLRAAGGHTRFTLACR